jgi:predicted O-methyltransferase YrrM
MENVFMGRGYIESLYKRFANELSSDFMMALKCAEDGVHDGGISRVDGELVYMLLRELNARNVIEFSPNQGYSTAFLAQALVANGAEGLLATFDLELFPGFVSRLQGLGLDALFHKGDALVNIPRYLAEHHLTGRIDFCFIDSDHTYDFARRYCTEIMPQLGEDCVYFIHDMCYRPMDVTRFDHYGAINPFEIGGTATATGEAAWLTEYFVENAFRYSLYSTHRCFGDQHECSTRLPRNEALIAWLTREIPGFSLPPSAGVAGGIPRPPMGLLAIPRSRLGAG